MRRVALITGASRGIGRACAQAFLRRDWAVTLVARHETELATAANALGGPTAVLIGDVADPGTSRAAVDLARERFGRLDAVVANAGTTLAKSIDDTTELELDRLLAVNIKSIAYLAKAAHPELRRRRGSFLVMASNKGLVAQRGSPIYVCTKGAAVQLARALALDWANEGIRVNAICPGLVDTDMLRSFASATGDLAATLHELGSAQPLGRLARPEDCAEAACFLASDAACFITGVALPVDGGFTAQ